MTESEQVTRAQERKLRQAFDCARITLLVFCAIVAAVATVGWLWESRQLLVHSATLALQWATGSLSFYGKFWLSVAVQIPALAVMAWCLCFMEKLNVVIDARMRKVLWGVAILAFLVYILGYAGMLASFTDVVFLDVYQGLALALLTIPWIGAAVVAFCIVI